MAQSLTSQKRRERESESRGERERTAITDTFAVVFGRVAKV